MTHPKSIEELLRFLRQRAEAWSMADYSASEILGAVEAAEAALGELASLRSENAKLTDALWAFDSMGPHRDDRDVALFCAGCDLDGDPVETSAFHDDDCAAARAALASSRRRG